MGAGTFVVHHGFSVVPVVLPLLQFREGIFYAVNGVVFQILYVELFVLVLLNHQGFLDLRGQLQQVEDLLVEDFHVAAAQGVVVALKLTKQVFDAQLQDSQRVILAEHCICFSTSLLL